MLKYYNNNNNSENPTGITRPAAPTDLSKLDNVAKHNKEPAIYNYSLISLPT